MRWTWIVCAVVMGCGPAVDTENEAETPPGGSSTSMGTTGDVQPTTTVPEPGVTTGPVNPTGDDTGPVLSSTGEVALGGEYFIAIFATPIAPTTPFQFVAEVKADAGLVVMSMTPLSLDILSVDTPREPLPPPFEVSGPIGLDGSFSIEIPELSLLGAANPITSSDIVASVTLDGVLEEDRICGRVGGMIIVPANVDLTGSILSGTRLDGGPLPLPVDLDCDQ